MFYHLVIGMQVMQMIQLLYDEGDNNRGAAVHLKSKQTNTPRKESCLLSRYWETDAESLYLTRGNNRQLLGVSGHQRKTTDCGGLWWR